MYLNVVKTESQPFFSERGKLKTIYLLLDNPFMLAITYRDFELFFL